MKDFDNIKFQGTFRNYQQRVLDASGKYLKNNKIHIVAAPGSGKTILGLELIRRLNAPCIVLSPTNTIRYQWGDRFEEMYLPKDVKVDDYISYDLHDVKLITSITYQAMHSSINKIACVDEDNVEIDYSNIDLFKLINEYGIKTICVDEAHHLQNEWQKALEMFMAGLPKDTKVIALTATPPYDATQLEWNRYTKICGEIDEEIYVSELVKAKNLCPHQDYVYLNYPTEEESIILKKHKENISLALEELKALPILKEIPAMILKRYRKDDSVIFNNIQDYLNLCGLLQKLEVDFNEKDLMWHLDSKEFPKTLESYENALNFLIKDNLIDEPSIEQITTILKKYKVMERGKVSFTSNSKIEKELLASLGKLESILKIVDCESNTLQKDLRLLILTDYIKKPSLNKIGTNELFKDISIISIFENIRRHNPKHNIAVVSGTLVILPSDLEKDVRALLKENAKKLSVTPLNDTGYSEFVFKTSNKEKVAVVGKIFEEGKVNIVVGTKSLLGEGWDSPCINALIMASFVGSFMLSNQMRGRAIRTYKKDPNKTANIWHLVTLEPEDNTNAQIDCNEETSSDYKTLKRRFNCFVGPHYTDKSIESGIDRVSILHNSYTKESVAEVNHKMEELSKDRSSLFDKWQVKGDGVLYMQSVIPRDRKPTGLRNLSIIKTCSLALISTLLIFLVPTFNIPTLFKHLSRLLGIYTGIMGVFSLIQSVILSAFKLYVLSVSYAIRRSLLHCRLIHSPGKIKIKANKTSVKVQFEYGGLKEQKVFLDAIEEYFSPIGDPRYIICKTIYKLPIFRYCYQVPNILATNKEMATNFQKNLVAFRKTKLIYVKSIENKRLLYRCKRKCYIKQTNKSISQKQVN